MKKENKLKIYNPQFSKIGYIQSYWGFGKSKTSSAIGLTVRAIGQDWNVLFIMYTKGRDHNFYGEIKSFFKRFKKHEILIKQFGNNEVLYYKNLDPKIVKILQDGWKYAKQEIHRGFYDLIVLDELHILIDMEIIDIDDVINTLKNKPQFVEIVTTGRPKIKRLFDEVSHLVTEMKPYKHYWDIGVEARKGIEY